MFHQTMTIGTGDVRFQIARFGKIHFRTFSFIAGLEQLGKETPTRAIACKVVQAHVSSHSFEPAGNRWAVAQIGKALVGFQKYLLRNILGLRLIGDQTHGRAEDHVLVLPHKRLELFCICHQSVATVGATSYTLGADEYKTLAYKFWRVSGMALQSLS